MANVKTNKNKTLTLTMKVSYDGGTVSTPGDLLALMVENEFELAAMRSGVLTPSGKELIRQLEFDTSVEDEE